MCCSVKECGSAEAIAVLSIGIFVHRARKQAEIVRLRKLCGNVLLHRSGNSFGEG